MRLTKFTGLIIMALCSSMLVKSQTFIERIYLNDSTFHEGYIIEQVPTQYLKINRLKEMDTLIVPFAQIWKITKIYQKPVDTIVTPKTINLKRKYVKTAYLELLGNAGLYSINFDMRTTKGIRDKWGFRVGLESIVLNLEDSATNFIFKANLLAIPFGINYLVGKKKGALELGAGATYLFLRYNGQFLVADNEGEIESYIKKVFGNKFNAVVGTFNVGYRHTPYKKGITYRVLLSPLFVSGFFIPSMAFSVGYKF